VWRNELRSRTWAGGAKSVCCSRAKMTPSGSGKTMNKSKLFTPDGPRRTNRSVVRDKVPSGDVTAELSTPSHQRIRE
jgi:hypothetical protein